MKDLATLFLVLSLGFVAAPHVSANEADDMVRCTNYLRAQNGLPPLYVNPQLSAAALYHARNMAYQYRSAHTLDGLNAGDRIRAFGYPSGTWAENIAWNRGYRCPGREAVRFWANSPGHRANMLSPYVNEIGVGIAVASDGTVFFCQVFGAR